MGSKSTAITVLSSNNPLQTTISNRRSTISPFKIMYYMLVFSIFCLGCWTFREFLKQYPPIVPREEWATGPMYRFPDIRVPISHVVIATTGDQECSTKIECIEYLQGLENSLDVNDKRYNFYVGGDGNIYEWYGWINMSTDLEDHNDTIEIAFIGEYILDYPSQAQLKALDKLLVEGVRRFTLSRDYKIYSDRNNGFIGMPHRKRAINRSNNLD